MGLRSELYRIGSAHFYLEQRFDGWGSNPELRAVIATSEFRAVVGRRSEGSIGRACWNCDAHPLGIVRCLGRRAIVGHHQSAREEHDTAHLLGAALVGDSTPEL